MPHLQLPRHHQTVSLSQLPSCITAASHNCAPCAHLPLPCCQIACNNAVFSDNYGQRLDRAHVCYDSNASVVVQITDLCPCHYPENAYSNKRWYVRLQGAA